MDASKSQSKPAAGLPKEAAAILEPTFQRILAEAMFADAWSLPASATNDAMDSVELRLLVPLVAPWKGSVMVGATESTAIDLAAGFHSLPDAMVDRALALEFLAELAEMLARDLFCASDIPVEVGMPSELRQETATDLWSSATGSRCVLGCNGSGRMAVALLAPTE